jgi:excisionase family DNA binding protein
MGTDTSDELLSLQQAAALLGVKPIKVSRLIKAGELPVAGRDPMDKRSKLVRRSDVEALLQRTAKKAAA